MNLQFMKRSHAQSVPSPLYCGGSIAMTGSQGPRNTGHAMTCTERRDSNPSGMRITKRVSNNLLRMMALLAVLLSGTMYGQTIKVKDTSIHDGDRVSTLSELTIDFDFSEAAASLGMDESELGVSSALEDFITFRMLVYKGDKNSEYIGTQHDPEETPEILAVGWKTISKKNVEPGNHAITIPFNTDLELEEDEHYTIYVPEGVFRAGIVGTIYKSTLLKEPIIIEIVGEAPDENALKMVSFSPSSEEPLKVLSNIEIEFNQEITLKDDCVAYVSISGVNYAQSVSAEVTGSKLTLRFPDVVLYTRHNYTVNIPAGSIAAKESNQGMASLNLFYDGSSYNYLEAERIAPSVKKPVSWLSAVDVLFSFPEGYIMGHVEGDLAKLYEGSLDSEPVMIPCLGDGMSTLIMQPMKFDLKPNTTYYLVFEEGQIIPERADNSFSRLKDTTNPRLELAYTTPDILDTPAKVELSRSTPENMEACERLDDVILSLVPYEFEYTKFEIVSANKDIKALFSDGTTETSVPLIFKGGETSAKVSINRPLDPGKEYTLRIPANTFIPLAHENLAAVAGNDEILLTFTGKKPISTDLTFTYLFGEVGSLACPVKQGETVTVNVAGTEDWKVKEVLFNDEAVSFEGDEYVTPELTADATIAVTYEFARPIDFDFDTHVGSLEDCPYSIATEDTHVIVSGLHDGDMIAIYTPDGMKVAALPAVPAGMDKASFSLTRGNVYIILINRTSVKISI